MTMAARLLQNGPGNYVDHNKYMDNWFWLFSMAMGSALINGGMEQWNIATSFTNPSNGAALADAWALEKGGTSSATADITRESTTKDTGSYSMKILASVAGSSNSFMNIIQFVGRYARFVGQTVTFGVRVKMATASKVRLSVTDGVSVAYSNYHTGDGTWQLLTATIACAGLGTMTQLVGRAEINSDFITDPIYIDSSFMYVTDPAMSATALASLIYFRPDDPQVGKTPPTVQKFLSGSGTYTLPDGVLYIRVRAMGAGGGGGGSGTAALGAGGTGGTSTFGTSLLSAVGGGPGTAGGAGGAGGTASLGTGPVGLALTGGAGNDGTNDGGLGAGYFVSSPGAGSPFAGGGKATVAAAGGAGVTNSGAGGGGGGGSALFTNFVSGAGGGAGGFIDAIITNPLGTYSYAVGAAGTAGAAGTNGYAGGAGGSGLIIVEEFYA